MAWTNYQIFLALLMVVTGSINTLSTKWADDTKSKGKDGIVRKFDHPFFQASCMFLGELLCLLVFKICYKIYASKQDGTESVHPLTKGTRDFNPLKLFIPAMCDMTGTSLMYIGLNMTYASSFQMFRGSVIIFVGLLSVGFLERRLKKKEWFGILMVIIGLAVVGASDFINGSDDDEHGTNDVITGDLLIIIAQIITAVQMVVEEKFVSGLDIPPLQAVGWEGLFGLVTLSLLQIPFYFIPAGPPFSSNASGTLEDAPDAFCQIWNSWQLLLAISGTVFSIAFFNFAGISVTKEMSATTRMVLDSVRTLVIWLFSLAFFRQQFQWLQLLGFLFLLYGMALYNNINLTSFFGPCQKSRSIYNETIENRDAENTDENS